MTTSAPSYWTCQCGVQVPMGCSHTCAHVGPTPGREITVNPPWPTELIAALTERADAAEAALAETRERLEGVERENERLLDGTDPVIDRLQAQLAAAEAVIEAAEMWAIIPKLHHPASGYENIYHKTIDEIAAALSAYRATTTPAPRGADD